MVGSYLFEEKNQRVAFTRSDGVSFDWNEVQVEGDKLQFSVGGKMHSIARSSSTETGGNTATAESEPVLAIFPFSKLLVDSIVTEYSLPEQWVAQTPFRAGFQGFSSARLLEATSEKFEYPYVAIDRWSGAGAYTALENVIEATFPSEAQFWEEEPGLYKAVDKRGGDSSAEVPVISVALLEIPDNLRDTFMSQWDALADFAEGSPGFGEATLYRTINESEFDYVILATWETPADFMNATESEFFRVITEEGTYGAKVGIYKVAAAQ
jgi:heme-degrading monooxygenase HmoA